MNEKSVNELLAQLEDYCGGVLSKISNDKCSLADCKRILGELEDVENGELFAVVGALLDKDAFDGECQKIVAKTFYDIANKLVSLKGYEETLDALEKAKGFEAEEYAEQIAELENRVSVLKEEYLTKKRKAEAFIEEAKNYYNGKNYESALISLEKSKEFNIEEYAQITSELEKKIRDNMKSPVARYVMVVAAIATVGILATVLWPKTVSVTYSVPVGTKVMIDGKDMGDKVPVKLKAGEYKLALEHPIIKIDHPSSIKVENEGSYKVINGVQLLGDKKSVVEKTYKIFMDDLLKNACTSENMRLIPSIYNPSADANGKIGKSHKAMRDFAVGQNISSMTADKITVLDTLLKLSDDDKQAFVQSKAEIIGNAGNALKIKYTVKADFIVVGQRLKVSSLNAFDAEIAE